MNTVPDSHHDDTLQCQHVDILYIKLLVLLIWLSSTGPIYQITQRCTFSITLKDRKKKCGSKMIVVESNCVKCCFHLHRGKGTKFSLLHGTSCPGFMCSCWFDLIPPDSLCRPRLAVEEQAPSRADKWHVHKINHKVRLSPVNVSLILSV